jgi:hypothetical protein
VAVSGSTPDETFRGTIRSCTPNGEPHTVIVTRQGLGNAGRVWLTFNGAIRTTVVMTNPETVQLCELLTNAAAARHGKTGTDW